MVLRFCQGLAIGGQWGGAALVAVENAPPDKRGLYGSLPQLGVPVGMILANIVFLLVTARVSSDAFSSWGWRIPFALSLLLVAVGLYVQGRLEEAPEFQGAVRARDKPGPRPRSPVLEVLVRHPREVLLAAGSFVASNGSFYVLTTFAIAYGTTNLHLPRSEVLWAVLVSLVIISPLIVLAGALSDRFGRRAVYVAGGVAGMAGAFLAWRLIDTGAFPLIVLGLVIAFVGNSLMYGPQPALFSELFAAEFRYSGASIGYQLAAILGGGFAPMIATGLIERFHASAYIAGYMVLLYAVSLISTLLLFRARRASPGAQASRR